MMITAFSSVFIPVVPVPKPRMTRRDKWKQRDCVMRYRQYKDDIRPFAVPLDQEPMKTIFFMPMPDSWSKKRKALSDGQLHRSKPDADNLLKGLMDAWLIDDAAVASIWPEKRWSSVPGIRIERIHDPDNKPSH